MVEGENNANMDNASEEFLDKLENSLVEINREYELDKDYQQMLTATPVSYPNDAITFG